ncbi:MAG: glycosyltransferase [Phycisphaerae bacterium]|nr:glycosyltransferase [Phycisphaerae bacterium]
MHWIEPAENILLPIYAFVLTVVCIYGFHRYVLVYLYCRHRKNVHVPGCFDELPHVTVQLPMYNEPSVAKRIIDCTAQLDYPRDRLQIQVLDDSDDETPRIAKLSVDHWQQQGVDISYIARDNRIGYKAGALANGLTTATGEFVAIFDADFVPGSDIINRAIHHFTDPKVCTVQARWDHLNRNDSLLTRIQAICLDGHFAIEHVARNRSGRFISFNGTAGIWRRTAIDDAGGWAHDTLTEDLDLSYRAQLRGWVFVFLPELAAPAELPAEMESFKAQQFRWTKGGVQTAIKLLPRVMRSSIPLKTKVEAFFHLTGFAMHIFMLLLVLLMYPVIYLRTDPGGGGGSMLEGFLSVVAITLGTASVMVFYAASQLVLFGDWRTVLKFMPAIMATAVGLCVSNTKAIIEACCGKKSEFVRTPKYGLGLDGAGASYTAPRRKAKLVLPILEILMGVYMLVCAIHSVADVRMIFTTPFLLIFMFGFFYVGVASFLLQCSGARSSEPSEPRTESVVAD